MRGVLLGNVSVMSTYMFCLANDSINFARVPVSSESILFINPVLEILGFWWL